jgi:hypothetical protein
MPNRITPVIEPTTAISVTANSDMTAMPNDLMPSSLIRPTGATIRPRRVPLFASPARPSAAQIAPTSGSSNGSDRNMVKIGSTRPLPAMIAARPGPAGPSELSTANHRPMPASTGTTHSSPNPITVRGRRRIQRSSERSCRVNGARVATAVVIVPPRWCPHWTGGRIPRPR